MVTLAMLSLDEKRYRVILYTNTYSYKLVSSFMFIFYFRRACSVLGQRRYTQDDDVSLSRVKEWISLSRLDLTLGVTLTFESEIQ